MSEEILKKRYKVNLNNNDLLDLYNAKNPLPIDLIHKVKQMPRYYQINGIYKLNHLLEENFKRILFIMPTGTGKTLQSMLSVLSVDILKTLNLYHKIEENKKIRVLFIVHKRRLLRQAEKLYKNSKYIELIPQSAFMEVPKHIIEEKWDITIIDEAHHEAMTSIQLLLDQLGQVPIIGFTANANRGDNLLVKFEKFIVPITKKEAIIEGFISEPGINTITDTGKQDKSDTIIAIVKKYIHCMGNTIVFFKTSAECRKFHYFCVENNISSCILDSSSTENDLDDALDSLSNGRIQFLINCKKVDEGIDIMNCTDVILARSFSSKAEKEQLAGRAIRPDTPCTIWELINPYINSVEAKEVVGSYRFHRFIYYENKDWHDVLISGEDPTWGKASELRFEYIKQNFGYDPRFEEESSDAIFNEKEELIEEPPIMTYEDVKKNKVVTRRIIYDAVDYNLKEKVKDMDREGLLKIAKVLIKSGRI